MLCETIGSLGEGDSQSVTFRDTSQQRRSGQHSRTNHSSSCWYVGFCGLDPQLNSGEVQLTPFCHSPEQHTFAEYSSSPIAATMGPSGGGGGNEMTIYYVSFMEEFIVWFVRCQNWFCHCGFRSEIFAFLRSARTYICYCRVNVKVEGKTGCA